jgi:ATP-binding cassette subfamily B protein
MENSHSAPHHHDHHPTPVARLWQFLGAEKSDLLTLIAYTTIAGILALVVPLTAQALVNTIAAGVLLQPLVVLSLITLVGMLLSGGLQLMKLSLTEVVQQRVFARTALQMADKLPRLLGSSLRGEYAPELVNRFFDTLTVQKALSKLLLDGLAALLQAMVGLVLLAFYSPYLLGLDIAILLCIAFIIGILGIGGLRTSIEESREKYRVADWLEDMARCHADLKMHGAGAYLLHRADGTVMHYVTARRSHFRVLYRQALGNYLFQAVASAAVLAVGGWLVINRQLTLGQLVASQLVVASLLAALDKLVRQADQVFDLLTGLDKVGHVLDMPTERVGGIPIPHDTPSAPALAVQGVRFSYAPGALPDTLTGLTLSVAPGERACIVGESGAGKSTLAGLIAGLETPTHGEITVGGVDVRDADLTDLRRVLSLGATDDAVFDGTVEENIAVGRPYVSHADVREAIELAQLSSDVARLPNGVSTMLVSGGQPLSRGQRQRLLLARTLAGNPRLLLLDEAFNGMDEAMVTKILDGIYAPERNWSILAVTHKAEVVMRSQIVYVLHGGTIVESGAPDELAQRPDSRFAALFPTLCSRISPVAEAVA